MPERNDTAKSSVKISQHYLPSRAFCQTHYGHGGWAPLDGVALILVQQMSCQVPSLGDVAAATAAR